MSAARFGPAGGRLLARRATPELPQRGQTERGKFFTRKSAEHPVHTCWYLRPAALCLIIHLPITLPRNH